MDFSDFRTKKMLVVDDFANVRKSVKGMLQDLGVGTVIEAGTDVAADKAVKETKFDLILCDYNLGAGRDGARLLEEWRVTKAIGPSTIFVLITAETSREIVVSAMEFQPDDYLAKPFSLEVLSTRLMRWFERRQALLPLLVSLDKQDWQAVAQTSRQVIEHHPRHRAIAQKQYVEALILQNQLTEAESFLHGLLENRFQSWAQAALHRIDILHNKFEAAESGLKDLLVRDPNLLEGYDFLVQALRAQDKDDEVQEWLEQAIARAPKNIVRQKQLVQAAQKNLDFNRASTAMRDVIGMAADTMHQSLGDYQDYIKNLQVEAQYSSEPMRQREIQKEIGVVSRKMNDRYQDNDNSKLFNKALSVQRDADPKAAKHDKVLNELFKDCFAIAEELIPETALFITETYYMAERFNDADEMVRHFKQQFSHRPDIVQRFDDLQAEPISVESREAARELNMKGIGLYKKRKFAESIELFQRAMGLSPRHPGIILNFVQSHLLRMKEDGVNKQEVELCLEYIERLNYLPEDHYQYERFSKLRRNLQSLK